VAHIDYTFTAPGIAGRRRILAYAEETGIVLRSQDEVFLHPEPFSPGTTGAGPRWPIRSAVWTAHDDAIPYVLVTHWAAGAEPTLVLHYPEFRPVVWHRAHHDLPSGTRTAAVVYGHLTSRARLSTPGAVEEVSLATRASGSLVGARESQPLPLPAAGRDREADAGRVGQLRVVSRTCRVAMLRPGRRMWTKAVRSVAEFSCIGPPTWPATRSPSWGMDGGRCCTVRIANRSGGLCVGILTHCAGYRGARVLGAATAQRRHRRQPSPLPEVFSKRSRCPTSCPVGGV